MGAWLGPYVKRRRGPFRREVMMAALEAPSLAQGPGSERKRWVCNVFSVIDVQELLWAHLSHALLGATGAWSWLWKRCRTCACWCWSHRNPRRLRQVSLSAEPDSLYWLAWHSSDSEFCRDGPQAKSIPLPVSVNKVLREHSHHAHTISYRLWLFHAKQQSSIVMIETLEWAKSNVFTIWTFTEKLCRQLL